MNKTQVHWIVNIVPLVGLLLTAVIYVLRSKHDGHLPARPAFKASRLRVNEFAPAPLNTSNFKDAELIGTATGPRSAPLGIPDGREAFNSLQAELLGIAERVERGEADLQELHRAAADYDALREAALASAKLH